MTSTSWFYFGADPYHDRDPEIFNEIFTTAGWANCEDVARAGSAVLAEFCRLQVRDVNKITFLRPRPRQPEVNKGTLRI